MLVFLLFCTFLQTLWAKPLSPLLGPSFGDTASVTGVIASEQCPAAPDNWCQQLRSVYDIVQSCLLTIFACVWTSIHSNTNGPRDSWWTRMKRRVVTTFYTVIAPEMVLYWALCQRIAAKEIAEKYNREFKTSRETEKSIWAKFGQLFRPLPRSTTRRGTGLKQQWTITHGFFIQMGGFLLYEKEYPKEALTYDRLAVLLRKDAIDAPTVTERELQDRSKGDTISKGIVLLQTSWFVLQCIVRAVQHLPLSELEVLTLAFAVLNGAIYATWWDKPQGVDTAIWVPLKQVENRADDSHSATASLHPPDDPHSDDKQPLMQSAKHQLDEDADEKDSWLQRTLRKDRRQHSTLSFLLLHLPYRLFVATFRPLSKMLDSSGAKEEDVRLPMFYGHVASYLPEYAACIIGTVFGGIHLLGWSLEFPLLRDRIFWQISAIVLTVAPVCFLLAEALSAQGMPDSLTMIPGVLFFVLVPFYFVARFIVIIIAFKAIPTTSFLTFPGLGTYHTFSTASFYTTYLSTYALDMNEGHFMFA